MHFYSGVMVADNKKIAPLKNVFTPLWRGHAQCALPAHNGFLRECARFVVDLLYSAAPSATGIAAAISGTNRPITTIEPHGSQRK